MTFWEILTLDGVIATILGIFIVIYAILNNKTVKENTRIIISKLDEGFRRMDENFQKVITKLDEGFRRIHEDIKEMRKEQIRGFKIIALLIVEEDKEKRRKLIDKLWQDIEKEGS